jgi:hypothetical protein
MVTIFPRSILTIFSGAFVTLLSDGCIPRAGAFIQADSAGLDPLDRPVMLAYLEDPDADSIAEITGLAVANARKAGHRGLRVRHPIPHRRRGMSRGVYFRNGIAYIRFEDQDGKIARESTEQRSRKFATGLLTKRKTEWRRDVSFRHASTSASCSRNSWMPGGKNTAS